MLRKMLSTIYIIPFLIIATPCWADLPLKIEDLLTEKQKFRFELRLGYANADRSHLNTNFALLKENRDILALTLGARYGITARTELYSRLTAAANDLRTQNNDETHSYSSKQWKDLVLGVNHQFSADNDTPALLGFAEILAFENTVPNKSDFVYGKTGKIGFTTYRSIDPVILSLTGGYSYAARREVNEQSINPGNLLFINPKLSFVINDEVTLTGGAQFQLREKNKVDDLDLGIRTSQTNFDFDVGYAASKQLALNFHISHDMSGDNGAQASFDIMYKF